jgi:2-polyprenyl-3-methyl-5-hydroxy-6-metoxy-1,4-benzoquinol methylase
LNDGKNSRNLQRALRVSSRHPHLDGDGTVFPASSHAGKVRSGLADIHIQQEFYDRRWNRFMFANRTKVVRCAAILEHFASLKLHEPRIIDLGCGAGWLAGILGNFGPTVGVELSPVAVEQAARKYPYVQFIQADILEWQCPEGEFDVVVSQEVLEHVLDQAKYLDVVRRLLKPGGHLILTTPNARTCRALLKEEDQHPLEEWITLAELRRLLKRRFEGVRISTTFPVYGVKKWWMIANSTLIKRIAGRLGLRRTLDRIQCWCGCGLHAVAVARKPRAARAVA